LTTGTQKKIFYDWLRHDQVLDPLDALVVSCNIGSARMGHAVGEKGLKQILDKFYFNTGNLSDQFLDFKNGQFNTKQLNQYQIARLSVGLDEITSTTFHLGLFTSIIAKNGTIFLPYIIKSIRNVLDLGFYNHQGQLVSMFKDNVNFLKVKEAMIQVVDDDRGTARRARVEFVRVAAKTGQAGERKTGFDAMLTGFYPARNSQYCFAFRLERGGTAQRNGAIFLKDFLKIFYNKNQH
jgi:cell division protein FtsI/penicillin-binding protein 2